MAVNEVTIWGIHGGRTGDADSYEQFDSRYKGLLPLKRVYMPEPLEDGGE